MNTYHKSQHPNVFYAKCDSRKIKGEIINVTTKYGKENECEVFNLIFEKDGFSYYSIIRADGTNTQTRAATKAARYSAWANAAENKSNAYYEASHEGKDFLVLAEPIKIGHHSEKRHRALIDRNWSRMGKSVEFSKKAENHESKSEYWSKKENDINLSMPESIEFYEYKVEEMREKHTDLKNNPAKRSHSFSLTYAKKDLNNAEKNLEVAKKLWS